MLMTYKSLRTFIIALLAFAALLPLRSLAAGYAFSGLSINKLNVFWEGSVADPTNLTQGPLRDGTGSQVDLSDLNPNGGGGFGSSKRGDLESSHATGTLAV